MITLARNWNTYHSHLSKKYYKRQVTDSSGIYEALPETTSLFADGEQWHVDNYIKLGLNKLV